MKGKVDKQGERMFVFSLAGRKNEGKEKGKIVMVFAVVIAIFYCYYYYLGFLLLVVFFFI